MQSVVFKSCDEVAVKFSSTNVVTGIERDSMWYFEDFSGWWAIVAAKPGGLVEYSASSFEALKELVVTNDEKDGYYFFDGVHSVSDTTSTLEAAFRHNAILNGVIKLKCTGYTPPAPQPIERRTHCIGATPSAALACCEAQAAADCRGDGFQFQGAVVTTNTQGGGYNADMNYDCIKPK